MSFSKTVFFELKNNGGLSYDIVFGTGIGKTSPYYVMLPVAGDGEQPFTMCEDQGGAGELPLQFSVTGNKASGNAVDLLGDLQTAVRALTGNITYSGDTYNIWDNKTGGITPLAGGDTGLWDAIFESTLTWEKIN